MEFDGLFEDYDLDVLANNGTFGLEYYRQGKHVDEKGEFVPGVKAMLAGSSQLCSILLRSFRIFKLQEITVPQLKDYERAERFAKSGQRIEGFDARDWQRKARKYRSAVKGLLSGEKPLSETEIAQYQEFLNITSSILLESIRSQQDAFFASRGIHRL